MKQKIKIRNILSGLISLLCLYSCSEDEHYDMNGSEGAIYVNELAGTSTCLAIGHVLNTPQGAVGDVKMKFPVRSTMPVKDHIKVHFKINNELVQIYNDTYQTEYKSFDSKFLVLSNTVVTITKGDLESKDSVSIYMPKENFQSVEAGDYLIPVEIETVEGYLPLTTLKEKTTFYFTLNAAYNPHNVRPIGSEGNEGTLMADRTNWSISYTGDVSGGKLENLWDGNLNTYSGGEWRERDYWTIDLGTVHPNILGAYVRYWDSRYEWKSVKVSTSIDGSDWVEQGNTTEKTSGNFPYSVEGIAKFIFPAEARYIKLEAKGGIRGGSGWYIYEMNVYE